MKILDIEFSSEKENFRELWKTVYEPCLYVKREGKRYEVEEIEW